MLKSVKNPPTPLRDFGTAPEQCSMALAPCLRTVTSLDSRSMRRTNSARSGATEEAAGDGPAQADRAVPRFNPITAAAHTHLPAWAIVPSGSTSWEAASVRARRGGIREDHGGPRERAGEARRSEQKRWSRNASSSTSLKVGARGSSGSLCVRSHVVARCAGLLPVACCCSLSFTAAARLVRRPCSLDSVSRSLSPACVLVLSRWRR